MSDPVRTPALPLQLGDWDIQMDPLLRRFAEPGNEFAHKIHSAVGFPDITLAEFHELPRSLRELIIQRNRIISTDTYNRTMSELALTREPWTNPETGEHMTLDRAPATFTLQLRKAPEHYMVAAGLHEAIDAFTSSRISEAKFRFAREYYAEARVPYFTTDRLCKESSLTRATIKACS